MNLRKVKKGNITFTVITLIMAAILWYVMFMIKPINFWAEMCISLLILIVLAYLSGYRLSQIKKLELRHILIGIASATVLYFIFYAGNIVSGYLFPFKDAQISSVYSNRSQGSLLWIGLLLLLAIGPGEEIYWRGFIQTTFSKRFGESKGYLITTLLYAGVHVTTGNFMLVIAALVCGLFWGWLYKKEKSLAPVIISHALWDLAIFVLFPVI